MSRSVLITGAGSGLGKEIVKQFRSDLYAGKDWQIYEMIETDITFKDEIQTYIDQCIIGSLDVLINCAGVNEISFLSDLEEDEWDEVMDTNAKGIFLLTKALLSHLRGGTILNIISNASHIPMTASLAYNASKGAAEIMTKQMARELGKTHGITVFGISPNKLHGTGMSAYIDKRVQEVRGWTAEQAQEYQLASLPAGEETDPATLAEFIGFLLSSKERHKYLAGCIIPYGGPC